MSRDKTLIHCQSSMFCSILLTTQEADQPCLYVAVMILNKYYDIDRPDHICTKLVAKGICVPDIRDPIGSQGHTAQCASST